MLQYPSILNCRILPVWCAYQLSSYIALWEWLTLHPSSIKSFFILLYATLLPSELSCILSANAKVSQLVIFLYSELMLPLHHKIFLCSVWLHCIVGSLLWTHTISLLYWYVVVNAGIDCYICDTTAIDNEDRQVCDDTFTLSRGATVESGCAACTKEKTIASGVMFSKYDRCALWFYMNSVSKR